MSFSTTYKHRVFIIRRKTMKKKKDEFYFKNLNTCVEISYQAAEFLKNVVVDFSVDTIKENLDRMHELEQKADGKKHKMMTVLSQAFITPIEREDLVALSNYLDDITDAVEDVFLQIYMCNVDTIREDVPQMVELLLECIKALQDVIGELKRFKSSKTIGQSIIRVMILRSRETDCMWRICTDCTVSVTLGLWSCGKTYMPA